MTLQALALPAEIIFCETCCRYELGRPPGLGGVWPLELGHCRLTGEATLEVSLCGEYRRHEPIKTMRRLNEHPRGPIHQTMGHHMGPEATCANHPRGQLEPVCGISWEQDQRHPTECLFPRPECSKGRYFPPAAAWGLSAGTGVGWAGVWASSPEGLGPKPCAELPDVGSAPTRDAASETAQSGSTRNFLGNGMYH